MPDFRYFDMRKYSIIMFISSDKTLSSEKNDTKIIENGGVVLIIWSFLKHSHCQFSLHSRDISIRDTCNGFSDFHTLSPGSPLIRANKTERTFGLLYPP